MSARFIHLGLRKDNSAKVSVTEDDVAFAMFGNDILFYETLDLRGRMLGNLTEFLSLAKSNSLEKSIIAACTPQLISFFRMGLELEQMQVVYKQGNDLQIEDGEKHRWRQLIVREAPRLPRVAQDWYIALYEHVLMQAFKAGAKHRHEMPQTTV